MAKVTWTVSGYLKVDEAETTGTLETRPLANVRVRVSASTAGIFKSWGEVRTSSRGYFRLTKQKNQEGRRLKVEVRFDDEDLEIGRPILQRNWITVYESPFESRVTNRDLGTITFEERAGGELGDDVHVKHATWWYVVKRFMGRLDAEDPWLEYPHKIHITYPERVVSGSSWAEAITRTAHIHRSNRDDDGTLPIVLHEIMHLWDYQHNTGTRNWVCAAFGAGGTHGEQEQATIAFGEGFAEYAAWEILSELFRWPRMLPLNRACLNERGLTSIARAEKNDDGVTSGLRLLTYPQPYRLEVGTASDDAGDATVVNAVSSACDDAPDLDLWEVLRAFEAAPGTQWDTDWQVGRARYGLRRFLNRMADLNDELTNEWRFLVEDVWDPAGTVEFTTGCASGSPTSRHYRPLSELPPVSC